MYTKIKLDNGPYVFIPNGIINQAAIINYSLSDMMDVNIRIELASKDVDSFQKDFLKRIRAHKELKTILKNTLDIKINDINIASCGINIAANVQIKYEKYVQMELSKIALKSVSKFQK